MAMMISPEPLTADKARHAFRCLRRCRKFAGTLLEVLARRESNIVAAGGADFHHFVALKQTALLWSQQINRGLSGLSVRGELTPACAKLISKMRDPIASPLPAVLLSGVEAAAELGILLPRRYASMPQPSKPAGSTKTEKLSDAINAVFEDCPDHRAVMKALIDAVPDSGIQSPETIELAKTCSNAISEADAAGRQLKKELDVMAGSEGDQDKPAARRRFFGSQMQRPNRQAAATRLTPEEAARREWAQMDQTARSAWIGQETYIRQRMKEIRASRST